MKYLLLIGLMVNLVGCGDSINKTETSSFPNGSYKLQNVQITDLDDSGYTDLLITSNENSHWLHTKILKNKIS